MIDYSLNKCCKCLNSSTGYFLEEDDSKSYYCDKHFYVRKRMVDYELDKLNFQMFKDKDWYRQLFPERFIDDLNSIATKQTKLL